MGSASASASGPLSVGVVTIATNRYLDYWHEMALSADTFLFRGREVVLHVFTDRAADAHAMAGDFSNIHVNPVTIDALRWPEATLLRYEVFDAHRGEIDQSLLMHLDADMLLVDDVGSELRPQDWAGGMALVRHPGFRRPEGRLGASLYAHHPVLAAKDGVRMLRDGGLGTWETDPLVRAFVPRRLRRTYVCGGAWFGLAAPFQDMVDELAVRTRSDLNEGRIALWHDESHLNWFAAHHPTALLGSEYCFAPGFANLSDLSPRIIAVDKADDRTR
mgnify:CR=1 FL=1